MDYFKIQAKLLEAYGKEPAKWKHKVIDGNAYHSPDGTYIVIIPENYHKLAISENEKFLGFENVMKSIDDKEYVEAQLVLETRKVGKVTATKLKAEKFDVWVDEKKLKAYGGPVDFSFFAASPILPVKIICDGVLVGILSPMNLKS